MKKVLLAFASLLMMGTLFAQVTVTFNVDMSTDSTFNPETQHVYISGSFVDWTQPGENEDYMLTPDDNNKIYTITMSDIPTGEIQYKYLLWRTNPHGVAANGTVTPTGWLTFLPIQHSTMFGQDSTREYPQLNYRNFQCIRIRLLITFTSKTSKMLTELKSTTL